MIWVIGALGVGLILQTINAYQWRKLAHLAYAENKRWETLCDNWRRMFDDRSFGHRKSMPIMNPGILESEGDEINHEAMAKLFGPESEDGDGD